jgi:single-strand DNA-binding protein
MSDIITVAGLVATPIKNTTTPDGLEISSFRLASSSRRFDRATQSWVDGETNWFTITAFRQLAGNVNASLDKGHRVVVSGRLRVREWRDGEKLGRDVEIIADALGPDLAWGRAQYTRTPRQTAAADAGAATSSARDTGGTDELGELGEPDEVTAALAAGFPAERDAVAAPF